MTFLVRTVDYTATGREIVRDRELPHDQLTLGRTPASDIHLPDLALEQDHARIERMDDGTLHISAMGDVGFRLSGKMQRSAVIDPRKGAELVFATFTVTIDRGEGGATLITVQQRRDVDGGSELVDGFSLSSALPSKRAMAWSALAAILIAFLAIPVWSHLNRADQTAGAKDTDQVKMDASWSTGSLSLAHHALEDNCEACHVEPFQSVRDETCLSCHAEIADHADKPRLAAGRGPMSSGDAFLWNVAQTFGKEGPEACTTCHTEHEGGGRMEPAAQQFCASCHDGLDTRLTDTTLANAADFGTSHPQLQALVWTQPGRARQERIALGQKPRHNDGIKFPHDLHLAKAGGVARMAGSLSRYGDALDCADCHTPDADKVNFQPIVMEENCESCHSLVYDRVGSTFRTLRHGDVDQMRADLMAMDRAPRRPITSGRSRPGQYAQGGRYYQDFGRPQRAYIGISNALAPDGVCGECHLPTVADGKPSVMPVTFRRSFFVNGMFDHDAHKQEDCSTCHAADGSKSATDLLIPGIETCRTCHQGEKARTAEVPSTCAMCHSYHEPSGRKPKDHPGPGFSADEVAPITRRGR